MECLLALVAMVALLAGGGCEAKSSSGSDADTDADSDGDTDVDSDSDSDSDGDTDTGIVDDPETCYEAEWSHTYVGCDFWPTVLPNFVGTHFDYAVVVSNTGENEAEITIEFGDEIVESGTVAPGGLEKFYLPWVEELKHWTALCDTGLPQPGPLASKRVPAGAYHLESSVPVIVYQFNPIEYDPQGGPVDKDWSGCIDGCLFGCHSYTNDASLLLPSTATTGNYRITAPAGQNTDEVHQPGYFAVTGFEDGTTVVVQIGPGGAVTAGADIPAAGAGDVFDFEIGRGEVVLIVGTNTTDLSGSVINAANPVQVVSGAPCHYMPDEYGACDHLEESVLPAEAFGTRYFVAVPTNARGVPIGHVVHIVGNVGGTQLSYPSGTPAGAPTTLQAGQVYDLGIVEENFEVEGDHEFAVLSFLLGSALSDPGHILDYNGDPAQSNVMAVEQYRKRYVFLAPDDYNFSFADIVAPDGAALTLDGAPVTEAATPIGSGYSVIRVELDSGFDGAHVLDADEPVSLQVMGYGFATSYHYPGGLNLLHISDPPVIE